jgi:hypothetical protein
MNVDSLNPAPDRSVEALDLMVRSLADLTAIRLGMLEKSPLCGAGMRHNSCALETRDKNLAEEKKDYEEIKIRFSTDGHGSGYFGAVRCGHGSKKWRCNRLDGRYEP